MGMAMADQPVAPVTLTEGRFEGLHTLGSLRRQLLLKACESGAQRILALDPDFHDWPLSDVAVLDALAHWGRQRRGQLTLLAPDYARAERQHARFRIWRQRWDHLLRVASFEPGEAGVHWPTSILLVVGGEAPAVLRVLDFDHSRCTYSLSAPDRQEALEQIDAIVQRSTPAWPLDVSGL